MQLHNAEFLSTYATIGDSIAVVNTPDWTDSAAIGSDDGRFGQAFADKRAKKRGSPVVPNSVSRKPLAEEGDSVMYALTVLRGHYQAGHFVDDVFTPGELVVAMLLCQLAKKKLCVLGCCCLSD